MKERMLLLSFYLAYEAWVDAGAQPDGVFSRYSGLCGNLYDWCNAQKLEPYRCGLLDMMHADFITAGLDEKRPFNRPVSLSERSYTTETRICACHENKARLEWVRRQVAAFENVVEERDALREEHVNGGSGTRHAADIYFQLRQEHNLTREESLVEYVDTLKSENGALKAKGREVLREASYVYEKYNQMVSHLDGEFVDGQTLYEFDLLLRGEKPPVLPDINEERIYGRKE